MKLDEIKKLKQSGTYAGVRFDDTTIDSLQKYIEKNNIPNPVPDFHTTLLFSQDKPLLNYYPINYDPPITGKATEIKNLGDDKTVVVIFECPELEKRHKELLKEHDVSWDYESYIPHITLSYDAPDINVKDLTPPKFTIKIKKEYSEELDD